MKSFNDDQPILTPTKLLAYRRATGALPDFPPPRAVIFVPQKSLASYVLRQHPVRKLRGFLGEFYLFKRTMGQIALSTGFGIGAPVVAGLADEFIALGVKQFALIGAAGGLQPGLQPGSLVISTQVLRGEGVSSHYLPPSAAVDSSKVMTQNFSATLTKNGHTHTLGPTWTTDAPFRELRGVVLEHQRAGILAVDMEAAALLSVAQAAGLEAVVGFSIADQLFDGILRMDADLKPNQQGLTFLFDAVFETLSNA
jgi:uridine phosphorylase